jgi:hypothetical protein
VGFFSPSVVLFDFFLSRFWAFRNKGSSKTRLKKSRENLLSSQKKQLLTYVAFFFFSRRPLGGTSNDARVGIHMLAALQSTNFNGI